MDLKDVKHLAMLARLDIPEEEQEALLHDLTSILGYIDQVTNAKVSAHEIAAPEHRNAVRDDVVTTVTGSNTELLLEQAVAVQDDYVKVKKIL